MWKKAFALASLMVMLVSGVVWAATSVNLMGFTIDVVSHEENGDQSTWTYAVTAGPAASKGLSHWTLGLETCVDSIMAPDEGSYTTPTNIPACSGTYTCQSTNYLATYGLDPTTGVNGIKFDSAGEQLSVGNQVTHIFQITVDNYVTSGPLNAAVKAGSSSLSGSITGPMCGTPLAVGMTASTALAPDGSLLLWAAGLPAALTLALLLLRRSRQPAQKPGG